MLPSHEICNKCFPFIFLPTMTVIPFRGRRGPLITLRGAEVPGPGTEPATTQSQPKPTASPAWQAGYARTGGRSQARHQAHATAQTGPEPAAGKAATTAKATAQTNAAQAQGTGATAQTPEEASTEAHPEGRAGTKTSTASGWAQTTRTTDCEQPADEKNDEEASQKGERQKGGGKAPSPWLQPAQLQRARRLQARAAAKP